MKMIYLPDTFHGGRHKPPVWRICWREICHDNFFHEFLWGRLQGSPMRDGERITLCFKHLLRDSWSSAKVRDCLRSGGIFQFWSASSNFWRRQWDRRRESCRKRGLISGIDTGLESFSAAPFLLAWPPVIWAEAGAWAYGQDWEIWNLKRSCVCSSFSSAFWNSGWLPSLR